MSSPGAKRRLWLIAFGASVALHAAFLLVAGWGARHLRPASPVLRPIEIAIVGPSPAPPPAGRPVEPAPAARPRPARPAATDVAPVVGPSVAASEPPVSSSPAVPSEPGDATEPVGPRRLTLMPSETLGGWQAPASAAGAPVEPGRPALSAAEDAKARVDGWGRAFRELNAARIGGATGSLGALEAGVLSEFHPDVQTLRNAGRFGIGALSLTESYLDTVRRQRGALTPSGDPSTEKLRDSQMFPATSELSLSVPIGGSFVSICLGACGDTSHLVAALAVTVRILHDGDGRPCERSVLASSGDASFDAEALTAVDVAAAGLGAEAMKVPPVPVVSEWELSARAYRYSRGELLLDPLFSPPGQVIDSESGILGVTTMVREVRLVAVAY